MGHYDYYGWKPYVSVAERRRKAEREMQKLRKKGHPVSPVVIEASERLPGAKQKLHAVVDPRESVDALRERHVGDAGIEAHEILEHGCPDPSADGEVRHAVQAPHAVVDTTRVHEEPKLTAVHHQRVHEVQVHFRIDRSPQLGADERDVLAQALLYRNAPDREVPAETVSALVRHATAA